MLPGGKELFLNLLDIKFINFQPFFARSYYHYFISLIFVYYLFFFYSLQARKSFNKLKINNNHFLTLSHSHLLNCNWNTLPIDTSRGSNANHAIASINAFSIDTCLWRLAFDQITTGVDWLANSFLANGSWWALHEQTVVSAESCLTEESLWTVSVSLAFGRVVYDRTRSW